MRPSTRRRALGALLVIALAPVTGTAAPMAGTVLVEEGLIAIQRGNPPTVRKVADFARLELGDRVQTSPGARGSFSFFDSGGIPLGPHEDYEILRDGVHRAVRGGRLRAYQFARPLTEGALHHVAAFVGAAGRLLPQGAVEVRRAGERDWEEIHDPVDVWTHDSVRTHAGGRATLAYRGRARMVFEEGSLVHLQKDTLILEGGAVLAHWDSKGHRFEVQTPRSLTITRRGVLRVVATAEAGDRVHVLEGAVSVQGRGVAGGRELGDGTVVDVSPGGRLDRPRREHPGSVSRRRARRIRDTLRKAERGDDVEAELEELLALVRGLPPPAAPAEPAPEPAAPAAGPAAPAPPSVYEDSPEAFGVAPEDLASRGKATELGRLEEAFAPPSMADPAFLEQPQDAAPGGARQGAASPEPARKAAPARARRQPASNGWKVRSRHEDRRSAEPDPVPAVPARPALPRPAPEVAAAPPARREDPAVAAPPPVRRAPPREDPVVAAPPPARREPAREEPVAAAPPPRRAPPEPRTREIGRDPLGGPVKLPEGRALAEMFQL